MGNINKVSIVAMAVMAAVSFTNLFGVRIAGAAVFLGVIFFFINKAIEKEAFSGSGLDIKAVSKDLRKKSIWFWIAMPLFMDIVSITLAKLFLPGYIEHVIARTDTFVSFDNTVLLIVQLAVLALGEEIAWRAFFQRQLSKIFSIGPVLISSSILFAVGHIVKGNFTIVAYDVFFVFVNSILYGIIFQKSKNAWISTISHFAANLFSVIILVII